MTIGERIGALRRAAGAVAGALGRTAGRFPPGHRQMGGGCFSARCGQFTGAGPRPGCELRRADHRLPHPAERAADGSGPDSEGTVALESVRALLDEQAGTQRRAGRLHQWLAAALAALACVAAGACVFIAVYTSGRLNYFSGKLGGLEAAVAGIDGTIDARVAALEGSLQQQASLVASFDFHYGSPGLEPAPRCRCR